MSGCIQSSVSLLGPAITATKSGNVYQASLSYATNNVIGNQLKKKPIKYIKDIIATQCSKDQLVDNVNIKKKLADIRLTQKTKNDQDNYNTFMAAITKILK